MPTNRERIKYLRDKVAQFDNEIQQKQLQDAYIALQRDIAKGASQFVPIDDSLWEVMLPKERELSLLAYYHTLRMELLNMMRELEQQEKKSKQDKLGWLDSKWPARVLTIGGVTELTIKVYELGHYFGLWFKEDEDNEEFHGPR